MFHGLSPESVINSVRSMISLTSIYSNQSKKKPRSLYDLKSETGSFEMEGEEPFRHRIGFPDVEGSRSRDEDKIPRRSERGFADILGVLVGGKSFSYRKNG